MKKFKNLVFALLLTATFVLPNASLVIADDDMPANKVTDITCSKTKITVGSEFELHAHLDPYNADDDNLKWKIVGKKGIILFDDDDRNDDEAEFVALKAGTTKVRCSIIGKGKEYSKTFKVTVKAGKKNKLKRKGLKNITVEVDDDFDLAVTGGSAVASADLQWSIKNTSIIGFEYDDGYYNDDGFDAEFYAKKTGTTTITCKNTKTNKKVNFKITVIPDYDD